MSKTEQKKTEKARRGAKNRKVSKRRHSPRVEKKSREALTEKTSPPIKNGAKIKRKIFTFNIKKRFKHVKKLKVKRRYEKKEETVKKYPRRKLPIKLLLLFGILIILGAGLLYIVSQFKVSEAQPARIPPRFAYSIIDRDIISYGKSMIEKTVQNDIGYLLISYSTNATKVTYTLNFYSDVDSKDVYILDSQVYTPQSTMLPSFKSSLKSYLREKSYNVNDIYINNIRNLPENSILVIPTGKMPIQMLTEDDNLLALMKKSIIVVYIGYPMSNAIDANGNIIIPEDTLGFRFIKAESLRKDKRLKVNPPMQMRSPVYMATYKGTETSIIYGCISVMKIDNGYFIVFPQYLDSGWYDGAAAAQDVAELIINSAWHKPVSTRVIQVEKASDTIALYSAPVPRTEHGYIKLIGEAESRTKGVKTKIEIIEVEKSTNGYITISGEAYPVDITHTPTDIYIQFSENETYQIFPYLEVLSNGVIVTTERLPQALSFSAFPIVYTMGITMEPGEYLLVVRDDSNQYAKGYLSVRSVDVDAISVQWTRGRFLFGFVDDQGNAVPIKYITLYVDGKKIKTYRNTNRIELTEFYLTGGNHTFVFDFGEGCTITKTLFYKETNPLDPILKNPYYLFLSLVTIIAVVFAFYFVKPRKEIIFGLDIPDFPTVKALTVPVKKSQFLKIFDEVNKDYAWKFMPLKLEELKKGFQKIIYKGRPIHISDYNLEILLDELVTSEDVVEKNYYYALKKWTKESKRSITHLVLFRMLRDIFLENIVKFTPLGKAKECDVEIMLAGRKIYVHIFDDDLSIINRALKTVEKGKTIVIFESEHKLNLFKDHIVTPQPSFVLFKLEVERGNIILLPIEKMNEFIENVKGAA